MADDISIKLKLDGERDFQAALRSCNAELKSMNTEVKAVDATTKGAANSEETLTKKVEALGKASDSAKNKVETMRQIVEKQKQAQQEAARALEEAKTKFGENSKEAQKAQTAYNNATNSVNKWQAELNKATTEQANIDNELKKNKTYLDEAKNSTDKTAKSIDAYGKEVKEADSDTDKMHKTMAKTSYAEEMDKVMSKVADTLGQLSDKMDDAAKELDAGFDVIAKKTGATGKDLENFKGIAEDIFGSMPEDMEDVGKAVGEVNTRFKQTGEQLRNTSTEFLKFAKVNGMDVSDAIDQVDRIMTQFGVDTSQTDKFLGMLTKTGQDTGRNIQTLTSNLSANASTLKGYGFTLEESVSLLASFEENGVEASTALQGMKRAAQTYTEQGMTMREGIEQTISSIQNASSEQEAWAIGQETFGSRGFIAMTDAIREGRFSIDDLATSMEGYQDVVTDTYDATVDGLDSMKIASNNLKTVGYELRTAFMEAAAPAVNALSDALSEALGWFKSLPDEVQSVIGVIAGVGIEAAKVVPQIMDFATQVKTLKVLQQLAKDSDKASDALKGTKSSMGSLKGTAGAAAAVIGGVALGLSAVTDAAKQLVEEQTKLENKTKSSKDAYDSTRDSIRDLKETIDTYTTTEEKRRAIEEKIAEVQEANRQANRDYEDSVIDVESGTKALNDAMTGELDNWGSLLDGLTNGAVRMFAVSDASEAMQKAHKNAGETVENTSSDLEELNKMLAEVEAEEQAAAEVVVDSSGKVIEAKDAAIDKTGEELAAWQNLSAETQAVAQNVAEACGAMKDSITQGVQSVGNFFEEVKEQERMHGSEMKQNFQDQINAVKEWEENLAYLADKGINKEFLQYLADIGPQAANYVAAMKEDIIYGAGGVQNTVDEWNNLYKEKLDLEGGYNEEANKLLTSIGVTAAGGKEEFEKMGEELNAANKENGKFIVAGMVDGIKSAMKQSEQAGKTLGKNTVDAAAKGAQTQSPSRATLQTGKYIDQGLINGMNQTKSQVTSTARTVGTAIITTITALNLQSKAMTEGRKVGTGLTAGINATKAAVQSAAASIGTGLANALRGKASDVNSAAKSLMTSISTTINNDLISVRTTATEAGHGIADSLAMGIQSYIYLATQAAQSLASSAGSAAANVDTSAAYWAGYDLAHGMANGINVGASAAINAAAQMAARALKAAKDELGIKSPSKVFEKEVGDMAALGLAKGFNHTLDIETDGMIKNIQSGLPDMSQYQAVPNVYVYLGDRELSAVLSANVVRNIQGGVRAYSAAGGRR